MDYLTIFANLVILALVVILFLANMYLYNLVKGRGDSLEKTAHDINQCISKYLHHIYNVDSVRKDLEHYEK